MVGLRRLRDILVLIILSIATGLALPVAIEGTMVRALFSQFLHASFGV